MILDRIRAHGGDVIRDEYRFTLKPAKLSPAALEWLSQPSIKNRVYEEVWPLFADWGERAAIREYDGGQCRDDAERDAYAEIYAKC